MHVTGLTGLQHLSFAYFVINVDPVLLRLGPIVVHWYGLMYVVAISIGLWVITRWARDLGIHDDQIWGLFIWTAIAGLIGGRLYFVVQQPDLVQTYLLQPANIFKVWNGGMAFFGAIFCGTAALYFLAPRYGLSRWIAIDGGALFAAVGQIFGRVGNIINGDIVGQAASSGIVAVPGTVCSHAPCVAFVPDANILGWAVVYLNSGSFTRTGIAYQPAPIYEIGLNLIALAILWPCAIGCHASRRGCSSSSTWPCMPRASSSSSSRVAPSPSRRSSASPSSSRHSGPPFSCCWRASRSPCSCGAPPNRGPTRATIPCPGPPRPQTPPRRLARVHARRATFQLAPTCQRAPQTRRSRSNCRPGNRRAQVLAACATSSAPDSLRMIPWGAEDGLCQTAGTKDMPRDVEPRIEYELRVLRT